MISVWLRDSPHPKQAVNMSDLFWLSDEQMARLEPFFPKSHGKPRVDDTRHGQEFPNLTGGTAVMLPNHHLSKPVLIGEIQADGQFDIISQTEELPGDAWADYLPESAVLISDWKDLDCGMYRTDTETCVEIRSNI